MHPHSTSHCVINFVLPRDIRSGCQKLPFVVVLVLNFNFHRMLSSLQVHMHTHIVHIHDFMSTFRVGASSRQYQSDKMCQILVSRLYLECQADATDEHNSYSTHGTPVCDDRKHFMFTRVIKNGSQFFMHQIFEFYALNMVILLVIFCYYMKIRFCHEKALYQQQSKLNFTIFWSFHSPSVKNNHICLMKFEFSTL